MNSGSQGLVALGETVSCPVSQGFSLLPRHSTRGVSGSFFLGHLFPPPPMTALLLWLPLTWTTAVGCSPCPPANPILPSARSQATLPGTPHPALPIAPKISELTPNSHLDILIPL